MKGFAPLIVGCSVIILVALVSVLGVRFSFTGLAVMAFAPVAVLADVLHLIPSSLGWSPINFLISLAALAATPSSIFIAGRRGAFVTSGGVLAWVWCEIVLGALAI